MVRAVSLKRGTFLQMTKLISMSSLNIQQTIFLTDFTGCTRFTAVYGLYHRQVL